VPPGAAVRSLQIRVFCATPCSAGRLTAECSVMLDTEVIVRHQDQISAP
jgi:hypothetical protein